jgi:D-alanyl-lipoteichoic acid acyltransferase DltB (MBOAT superfamily)
MESIFLYKENEPLIFTNVLFWFFFAFVLFVYQFVKDKQIARTAFLAFFSLYFYYLSSGWFFLLLIFSTVVDYFIGEAIFKSEDEKHRKWLVTLSIVINLVVLAYFKYTFFFVDSLNTTSEWLSGTSWDIAKTDYFSYFLNLLVGKPYFDTASIFLPVGISFYTFQTISYSIDIYRRQLEPVKNIIDFGFYVSFFPQLVAGPIVRASEFVPQIYQKYKLSSTEYNEAIFLIINGLVKKMLISDYISANYVDRIFAEPFQYTGFENLMAIYGYAIQIYCDFSGYTDIAIGVALLLGFRLPINFNSPYKATSITDFWRRWHISLSSWLRDYLYIPLGGNQKGKVRTYVNLFLTMLLGGLWHGNAWRFVIWGALHGVALAVHKLWLTFVDIPESWQKSKVYNVIMLTITFHFVCFCWMYFRAADVATVNLMLEQIFYKFEFTGIFERIVAYKTIYAVLFLGFLVHWLPEDIKVATRIAFADLPDIVKAIIIVAVLLVLFQFKTAGIQPFIYFQF